MINPAMKRWIRCLTGSAFLLHGIGAAEMLNLEIRPKIQEESVLPATPVIQRLDFLLSKLALQRTDGTWVDSADWFAFVSLEKNRLTAQADGVPVGSFQAIRFDVGLPALADKADPNLLPPGHPLHPDVCGLHWGWQGGYVFMALEGRWQTPEGQRSGFTFHLAKTPNIVPVKIPVVFQGGGPVTLKLNLDATRLLKGIDFVRDGRASHSREGDTVLPLLKRNIAEAFSIDAVRYDLYQTPQRTQTALSPAPEGTHPYPLAITQRFPQVRLPPDNLLTMEGVTLGEKLFHDPRLSINNTQSCASCHSRSVAFSDPRKFSLGAEGQKGKRHAMALFNLAWDQAFFWDGRAKTLREQVLMPIEDAHEMNETLEHVVEKIADRKNDFKAAFGTDTITCEHIAKALEQYLLTLISQESRFDQTVRKVAKMTEEEKLGLQLFVTEFDPARGLRGADCFHCHGGTLFTDHQFKNNGLDLTPSDLGRMIVTGNPADKGKFKTPSLRNVAATAPYMHDGRFQTLEEVIEHYNSGVTRSETLDPNLAKHPASGLQLTKDEKRALIAFLKTLTDEEFIGSPSPSKLAQRP